MNRRQRYPNTDPWRVVVGGQLRVREGRGSLLGPDTSRRARWRELVLECGHTVERRVHYWPLTGIGRPRGGTMHRKLSDVLPAPKKVRCEYCADDVVDRVVGR